VQTRNSASEDIEVKYEQLYPMPELICGKEEDLLLPGSRDAAFMWASGLGSKTTPSTSTQAAPAPTVDDSTTPGMFDAWLKLLTNQVMERNYDC